MAGIGEKTKIATGEATTPPGVVPTALSSQQSQALGKARVDLSAVQAAVERSERATDNTVYPDSQEKSGPAGSTPGGGGSSGASPSMPPIPSAVTTQQSQALSKARVDLGAMASAIQGAMLQPPASPTNARAGEKDLTAVARDEGTLAQTRLQRGADTRGKSRDVVPSTPVFDAYVAELRRSAEEPFPEVADVPPGEPASSAPTRPEAAPPGAVDTADRTAPTQRRASSKPDYVAAPIRVGPPRRAGAVAPLGGGAAQGAASLGVPAPGGSAALGGDRAIVGSIDALPAPMADRVRDAEPC
ncbi:MAG: hypothetical protein L6Q95_12255, partial [Planctomycetes bacterium]|nr:hypothetical protein [Planctomycetota bacterium]